MENQLTKREVVALEFSKVFLNNSFEKKNNSEFERHIYCDQLLAETLMITTKAFQFADHFLKVAERTKSNG